MLVGQPAQQAGGIGRACLGVHNVLGRSSRGMQGVYFAHDHCDLENVPQDYEIGQAASQGKEKEEKHLRVAFCCLQQGESSST
jgi:hypothetical protein